jgi:UDP-glucoronosyl and UDP-glucosyl transferase
MLGALAAGVPLLCLPQGADQHSNADLVVAGGAGRKLLRDELTPATVREATAALLDEPSYRRAAHRIAEEISTMPTAVEALTAIMRFHHLTGGRPQPTTALPTPGVPSGPRYGWHSDSSNTRRRQNRRSGMAARLRTGNDRAHARP